MTAVAETDLACMGRYDTRGPRYTSYPAAPMFADGVPPGTLDRLASDRDPAAPLSLYVHVPFCRHVCFYCGCNRIVTANYRHATSYLELIDREASLLGHRFGPRGYADMLHLGGGTPTYLDDGDLARLVHMLDRAFHLERGGHREWSVEVDPRTVDADRVRALAELGFNRLSIGVQDIAHDVQQAINRIQSTESVIEVIEAARANGFDSVNLDLIYGLPRQSTDSFACTVDAVVGMRPDRIAVYGYAHLPERFRVQRQIDEAELPGAAERLRMLQDTIRSLTAAGYVYIGMDHFALPDDELAVALREGTLQRNFQGYATGAGRDLVALGVSAISRVGDTFLQNHRDLATWQDALERGELPLARSLSLTPDDHLRGAIIQSLMCGRDVMHASVEAEFGIDFRDYFAPEIARLEALADDGLVRLHSDRIEVLPRGRLLLRQVAMVFDAWLRRGDGASPVRYSRVI